MSNRFEEVNMKRRILFVDDEKNILDGTRRMLWHMRTDWEMTFTQSGDEALDAMAKKVFDVVVTDMRMPHMDGAELLSIVKERHPGAVRIILSGYAEREMTLKACRVAHQYLAKPSDSDTFKRVIGRSCALWSLMENQSLKHLVSQVDSLPSDPDAYDRIMTLLDQSEVSPQEIAQVIEEDLGMTAKILQLVNSAFFGLPRRFTDISEAVVYLGSKTLKSFALTDGLFSSFGSTNRSGVCPKNLFHHCRQVASIARYIADLEGLGKQMAEDAYLAGLLHDVGKLIIADKFPEIYRDITKSVPFNQEGALDLEADAVGANHAEIGAYLMGLWGLAAPIVEAIAYHHQPSRSPGVNPVLPGVVHAADILSRWNSENKIFGAKKAFFDMPYFEEMQLSKKLSIWHEGVMSMDINHKGAG